MKTLPAIPHRPRPCAGFTLIETIVAVATSSILLLALGSAVTVAARAVPSGNEPVVSAVEIERGLAMLLADFEEAIDYDKTDGSHVLHLGVPDRNADGTDDLVQYKVDGSKRLVRILNGGTPVPLFGNVEDFTISHTRVDAVVSWAEVKVEIVNARPTKRFLRVRLLNMPEER
jgi:competence protein ComGC